MKHKSKPENLPTHITWFETDFERTAFSNDIHLELHIEVLTWKKCLMEVQGLGTILHIRGAVKVLGIGVDFTLILGGLVVPACVWKRENSHYFNAHLKEILN